MIWYLIVCAASGDHTCLPAQRVPSRAACLALGKAYHDTADLPYSELSRWHYVTTRCVGVNP